MKGGINMENNCTVGQANFLKEIHKYKCTKNEAYVRIVNSMRRWRKYDLYDKCLTLYFDDCKNDMERNNLIESLS